MAVTGAAVALMVVVLPASTASADVNSDRTQIAQLEQRIASDGATVQRFVVAYNQAQAAEAAIQAKLTATRAHLAADQSSENQALTVLRAVALNTYMSDTDDGSPLALFGASGSSIAAQQEYTKIASAGLRDAIDAVTIDEAQTAAVETTLHGQQAQAEANLEQASSSQQSAQAALDADVGLLGRAKGNLQAALAAVARRLAAEEQEEEELAAQEASHPVSFSLNPSPGTYANPLRAIASLNPERIDQGVDYSGYGPIFAVGDGQILSTSNSGWPGGTFISYRLADGPGAGLVVYAAEDIDPAVSVGQSVTAGTVLGTMYEGPDGIETGWADPSGDGTTMARDAGQFSGANSTAYGANFSQLLVSVGAPPGVLQNNPPTGSLPPNWPTW